MIGPWVVPLIEAAAGAITTWWSTRRAEKQANETNSNQYQRMVRDLRMAGLNPMLAYQQGHGESGIQPDYRIENPAHGFSARYAEQKLLEQNLRTQKSIEENNRASAEALRAGAAKQLMDVEVSKFNLDLDKVRFGQFDPEGNTRLIMEFGKLRAEHDRARSEAQRKSIEVELAKVEKKLAELSMPRARYEARQFEFLRDLKSEDWKDWIKYLGPVLLHGAGSASQIYRNTRGD